MLVTLKTLKHSAMTSRLGTRAQGEAPREPQVERVEAVVEAGIVRHEGQEHAVDASRRVQLGEVRVQVCRGLELPPARVPGKRRHASRPVGHQDVHGHAGGEGPDRGESQGPGQEEGAREHEPVALLVGSRPVLLLKVVRVDGPGAERDLVVVRVVASPREGIGHAELLALAPALLEGGEKPVVPGAHARLEIQDACPDRPPPG